MYTLGDRCKKFNYAFEKELNKTKNKSKPIKFQSWLLFKKGLFYSEVMGIKDIVPYNEK